METTMSPLNRRQFIGASGAAIVASSLASHAHAAGGGTVRIGFIGVGNRGSVHVNNIARIPGVQVTAICDIKPENLERAQNVIAAAGQPKPWGTAKWRELLE